MEQQVVTGDKRLRFQVWLAVAVLLVGAAIGLGIFRSQMAEVNKTVGQQQQAAVAAMARLVTIVAWIAALSSLGTAAWFAQLAWRIQRAGQYPPPGMKVLRAKTVRSGRQARSAARWAWALAAGSLLGVLLAWYLWSMAIEKLGAG